MDLPESSIRNLFESDRRLNGEPVVAQSERPVILGWLRRVLIEFAALERHVTLLQQLYASRFSYPRPRRDRWDVDQPLQEPADSQFTHDEPLPDDRVLAILNEGVDTLDGEELARLTLNPVALFDLYDCIDEVQPDYWLNVTHDFVKARAPESASRLTPKATESHEPEAASSLLAVSSLLSTADLKSELVELKAVTLKLMESLSREKSPPMAYAPLFASLAAGALFVIGLNAIAGRTGSDDRQALIQQQQTEIARLSAERDLVRQDLQQLAARISSGGIMIPTSSDPNRSVGADAFLNQLYDPKASDEVNLKKLELVDPFRAQIAELRTQNPGIAPSEVLNKLIPSRQAISRGTK